jgi:hypothetical protein
LLLDGATELPDLETDELLEGALPILAVPELLEPVLLEVLTELLPLYVDVLFTEGVVPCTVLLFI